MNEEMDEVIKGKEQILKHVILFRARVGAINAQFLAMEVGLKEEIKDMREF